MHKFVIFLYIPLVSSCLRTIEPENTVLARGTEQTGNLALSPTGSQSQTAEDAIENDPTREVEVTDQLAKASVEVTDVLVGSEPETENTPDDTWMDRSEPKIVELLQQMDNSSEVSENLSGFNETSQEIPISTGKASDSKQNSPQEDIPVIEASLDSIATLYKRTGSSDYQRHKVLFRKALRAKTFRSGKEVNKTAATIDEAVQKKTKNAKSQSAKEYAVRTLHVEKKEKSSESSTRETTTTEAISTTTTTTSSSDMFEALSVEKPEMCASCPSLFLPHDDMSTTCANWDAVSKHFALQPDAKLPQMQETTVLTGCTRTVRCAEPHTIIRWDAFDMCDVHAASEDGTFAYQCNGTHWSMHGYPIHGILCASKKE